MNSMRKMNQIKFVWTFVWTWRRGQIPVQRPVISGRSRQGLGRYHGHLRRLKKEMEIAISTMRSQTKAVAVKLVLVICFFLAAQPQQTTVNQFPVPGTSSVVVEPTPPCVFVNVVMWQQLKRGKGQSCQFGCCPVFDTYPMRIGGVAGRVIERRADSERNCVTRVFNQVNNVAVVQPRDVMVIDGQNSVSDMQARTPLSGAIADDLT